MLLNLNFVLSYWYFVLDFLWLVIHGHYFSHAHVLIYLICFHGFVLGVSFRKNKHCFLNLKAIHNLWKFLVYTDFIEKFIYSAYVTFESSITLQFSLLFSICFFLMYCGSFLSYIGIFVYMWINFTFLNIKFYVYLNTMCIGVETCRGALELLYHFLFRLKHVWEWNVVTLCTYHALERTSLF